MPISETTVQFLVWAGRGLIAISLVLSFLMFVLERERAYRSLFFYWLTYLIPALVHRDVADFDFEVVAIISFGNFLSNLFLIDFYRDVHGFRMSLSPWGAGFAVSAGLSWMLAQTGMHFSYYSVPLRLAVVLPAFFAIHLASFRATPPRKRMFVDRFFALLLALINVYHLLWFFFRPYPGAFSILFMLSLPLYYLLSLYLPLLANEHHLRLRNESLELEVRSQVQQLTSIERRLWESGKLASLGRMAGGIAHELNSPLQVIDLVAENLILDGTVRDRDLNPAEAGLKLQAMVQRISTITEGLRQIARETRTTERRPHDLTALARRCAEEFADRPQARDIRFQTEIPDTPAWVQCNGAEISQVLSNLLENAADAAESAAAKWIELKLVPLKEHGVRITVEDGGHIEPDVAARIMEPFFTTKSVGRGKGLALSVSRSIIENHQGRLYLDTASDHTRFVIELPRSADLAAGAAGVP